MCKGPYVLDPRETTTDQIPDTGSLCSRPIPGCDPKYQMVDMFSSGECRDHTVAHRGGQRLYAKVVDVNDPKGTTLMECYAPAYVEEGCYYAANDAAVQEYEDIFKDNDHSNGYRAEGLPLGGRARAKADIVCVRASGLGHDVCGGTYHLPSTEESKNMQTESGLPLPPLISKTEISLVDGDNLRTMYNDADNIEHALNTIGNVNTTGMMPPALVAELKENASRGLKGSKLESESDEDKGQGVECNVEDGETVCSGEPVESDSDEGEPVESDSDTCDADAESCDDGAGLKAKRFQA